MRPIFFWKYAPLVRRLSAPLHRLLEVLVHHKPIHVKGAQVELRNRVALLRECLAGEQRTARALRNTAPLRQTCDPASFHVEPLGGENLGRAMPAHPLHAVSAKSVLARKGLHGQGHKRTQTYRKLAPAVSPLPGMMYAVGHGASLATRATHPSSAVAGRGGRSRRRGRSARSP